MSLKVENINLSFGKQEIFRDFNISFAENQINCILGPSGCGKTSLLNILSGLTRADQMNRNDFRDKRISYVFQDPRLLPWLTVSENIAFVLKDILKPTEIKSLVKEYLEMVRLEEFSDYYPGQLSGGMKQRVSLARAFSYPSDVILMDEPFKGLDIKLKKDLTSAFQALWNHRKVSVVWVSHDINEAAVPKRKSFVLSGSPVQILKSYNVTEEDSANIHDEIHELLSQNLSD